MADLAIRWLAAGVLAAALTAWLATPEPAALTFPPESGECDVLITRVIDGDTVAFAWLVRGRARIKGINAPEVHSADPAEKAAGLKAADRLRTLLPEGRLSRARVHGADKYGRTLLSLSTADGKSVAEEMVSSGHAKPYDGKGPRP